MTDVIHDNEAENNTPPDSIEQLNIAESSTEELVSSLGLWGGEFALSVAEELKGDQNVTAKAVAGLLTGVGKEHTNTTYTTFLHRKKLIIDELLKRMPRSSDQEKENIFYYVSHFVKEQKWGLAKKEEIYQNMWSNIDVNILSDDSLVTAISTFGFLTSEQRLKCFEVLKTHPDFIKHKIQKKPILDQIFQDYLSAEDGEEGVILKQFADTYWKS